MRIFTDLESAVQEIQRDLFEVGEWISGNTVQDKVVAGDPEFDFMELSPYVWSLSPQPQETVLKWSEARGLNLGWIRTEFYERIEKTRNPGLAWKLRPEVWEEFLESSGRFSYTYSERLHYEQQLKRAVEELKIHPSSRQVVLSIYNPEDVDWWGGTHRIPCSMFYQLTIRRGELNLFYIMRSCDFFTHFQYDVVLALLLQNWIAGEVGVPVGNFTHFVTSLHAFRKNFSKGVF